MTYSQYRLQRPGFVFMSEHSSSTMFNPDIWALNEEDAELKVVFSYEVRRKKRRNLCIWAIVSGVIFLYISFLLSYFWKQWTTSCIRQLSVWLAVYDGIIALQLCRALFLLHIWKVASDPSLHQVKTDCLWSIVFFGEICWYVYGNTFIYTSGSQYCKGENEQSVDAWHLWIATLSIICWGYGVMLYALFICCFACAFWCVYRDYQRLDVGTEHTKLRNKDLGNLPLINAMENYRQRRFSNRQSRQRLKFVSSVHNSRQLAEPLTMIDCGQCGLCNEDFLPDDTVLDCMAGHVFHINCFENQKLHAVQNVCPSCGQSMHLVEVDDNESVVQLYGDSPPAG